MQKPYVIGILPIKKFKEETKKMFESLAKQKGNFKFKLYISAGEMDEKEFKEMCKYLEKLKINYDAHNYKPDDGPAECYNLAIERAIKNEENFDYLLKLDDDLYFPEENVIEKLLQISKRYKDKYIVGPIIKLPNGLYYFCHKQIPNITYLPPQLNIVNEKPKKQINICVFPHGCIVLIPKRIFDEVGYFKSYYYIKCDDIEYGLRAFLKGFKSIVCCDVEVIHPIISENKKFESNNSIKQYYKKFNVEYYFGCRNKRSTI